MSAGQKLSTATIEEVSGWWPSEKSTKSRLKALFSRKKADKFGKQHQTDFYRSSNAQDPIGVSGDGVLASVTVEAKASNNYSTWPTRALKMSQRTGKQNRLIQAQKSLPNLFHTSSQTALQELSANLPASPVLLPPMPQRSTLSNAPRSTTASSAHTPNSFDRLRDRSCSDNRSISTTQTSYSSNTSSPLHTPDSSFDSRDSYEAPRSTESKLRILTPSEHDIGELSMYMQKPGNHQRPVPIRATSADTPATRTGDGWFTHKPLPAVPQLGLQFDKGRRISTVAPLPEPGHIRKTSARYRCDSRAAIIEATTPTRHAERPPSVQRTSSTRKSGTAHKRTASYSLYPRTPSVEQAHMPSRSTPSPTAPTTMRERAMTDSRPPSSSRSSRRFGKMLPLNIPTTCATALESPCSISSQEDAVKPPPPLRLAKAPARQQIIRQKSMPSLRSRSPPLGPPPDAPLPALPTEVSRWVSGTLL